MTDTEISDAKARRKTPKTAAAKTPRVKKAIMRGTTRGAQSGPEPKAVVKSKAPTKIDRVVAMLRREEGASITALMLATGWQAHSVRGIIAGVIKKKLALSVTSAAGDGGRTYRIVEGPAA